MMDNRIRNHKKIILLVLVALYLKRCPTINFCKKKIRRLMMVKKMIFIAQILIGIISPIILGMIFPQPVWYFVIDVAEKLESIGVTLDLVGEPATIDYGAVIVSVLYLCMIVAISYGFITKKYKVLGITFLISGFFMTNMVFIMISSIIWF